MIALYTLDQCVLSLSFSSYQYMCALSRCSLPAYYILDKTRGTYSQGMVTEKRKEGEVTQTRKWGTCVAPSVLCALHSFHKVKALSKSPKSAVLALDLSSAKKHCLHREQTLSRYTVQVSCMKCFGAIRKGACVLSSFDEFWIGVRESFSYEKVFHISKTQALLAEVCPCWMSSKKFVTLF